MRDTGRASAEAAKLAAFGIDPDRGFLPTPDPPAALPHTYVAWEELAAALPKLLGAGVVRDAIRRLPVLDTSVLSDDGRRRRAMLLLSYFGHAFVWGEDEPADVLPAPVAVPWARVAASLGRPPVLSYASYALDNWRRLDPKGPIVLHNLALLQTSSAGWMRSGSSWSMSTSRRARAPVWGRPSAPSGRSPRRITAPLMRRSLGWPTASAACMPPWAGCPSAATRTSTSIVCAPTFTAGGATRACPTVCCTRESRRSRAARSSCAERQGAELDRPRARRPAGH